MVIPIKHGENIQINKNRIGVMGNLYIYIYIQWITANLTDFRFLICYCVLSKKIVKEFLSRGYFYTFYVSNA